jgi:hypothetical protein
VFGEIFESLSNFVMDEVVPQVGAELGRLGQQGAAEMAAGLMADSPFYVPYGQGQLSPDVEPVVEQDLGREM